jgi:hypothetical protein
VLRQIHRRHHRLVGRVVGEVDGRAAVEVDAVDRRRDRRTVDGAADVRDRSRRTGPVDIDAVDSDVELEDTRLVLPRSRVAGTRLDLERPRQVCMGGLRPLVYRRGCG